MRKSAKIWLIAAASLVVIGLIMFAAVMTAYHWDFSDLSTDKYETNTYEIDEEFSSIRVDTTTSDILFAASDDGICRVVCYEQENMKHSVGVRDDTLSVSAADERKWIDHIGIHHESPKVTIYLPEAEYTSLEIKGSTGETEIPKGLQFETLDISLSTGDIRLLSPVSETVKLNTATGDINIADISADMLELNTSTGNMYLENVVCRKLISAGSTGDMILRNVTAAEALSVERSTGDVRLDASDAAEILIKTSTGDVTGTLLSEKVFVAESSTGEISVPKTDSGGRCGIETSTGDIYLTIQ